MGRLPTLRREHPDRLVLDSSQQTIPVLVALARAWREDPEGVGALFADIADRDDQARAEAHLDGLGNAEHARDQIADQLLTEAGGAEFHLRTDRDRLAATRRAGSPRRPATWQTPSKATPTRSPSRSRTPNASGPPGRTPS